MNNLSPSQHQSFCSSSNISRTNYERRMHKVFAHIDKHLDQALDLNALAEVAHFSPFHFHRLFAAWTGETLGDYLRRRRLEVAAAKLGAYVHWSVLDAALAVGFSSAEAFSRAFKLRFGSAPSTWRKEFRRMHYAKHDQSLLRNLNHALSLISPQNTHSTNYHSELAMNVNIVDRPAVHVAYIRHNGPYGMPINHFWRNTVLPWLAANNLYGNQCYGIAHDNPDITEPAQCRYDACVTLPEGYVVPRDMLSTTIPGGRYAVLPFTGTVAEVAEAWKALIREWLPASGMQFDARPCFEIYPMDPNVDVNAPVFSCEICISVRDL
jgi:AraC family transcriptional regulator